jgi:hypothetical protein
MPYSEFLYNLGVRRSFPKNFGSFNYLNTRTVRRLLFSLQRTNVQLFHKCIYHKAFCVISEIFGQQLPAGCSTIEN